MAAENVAYINEICKSKLYFPDVFTSMIDTAVKMPKDMQVRVSLALEHYKKSTNAVIEQWQADKKKNGASANPITCQKAFEEADQNLVNELVSYGAVDMLLAAEEAGATVPWKKVSFSSITNPRAVEVLARKGYDFNAPQEIQGKQQSLPQVLLEGMKYAMIQTQNHATAANKAYKLSLVTLVNNLPSVYEKEKRPEYKARLAKDIISANWMYAQYGDELINAVQSGQANLDVFNQYEQTRIALLNAGVLNARNAQLIASKPFETLNNVYVKNSEYLTKMADYLSKSPKYWDKKYADEQLKKSNQTPEDAKKFQSFMLNGQAVNVENNISTTLAQNSVGQTSGDDIIQKDPIDVNVLKDIHLPEGTPLVLGTPVSLEEVDSATRPQKENV